MYSSIIDKFGNIEKTQQNQACSCKAINTYTMTRKLTPTFKNIRQNCVRLTQIHCRIFPLNCVVLPFFFLGGGGGDIPKGGCTGRARFPRLWSRGADPYGLGPGEGDITGRGGGGRNP